MEQLMLINPRKRTAKRRPRTAAQRAATKRMVAANRARRSSGRAVATYAANPAPARRRPAKRQSVARIMRHRKRNPASRASGVMPMITGAFMGASGALLVNTVGNYVPMPASMQTPHMKAVVNGVLAIALGTFGSKFIGRRAVQMAEGALTVTLHDTLKNVLAGVIPMNLGYYSPAMIMGADNRVGLPAPAEQSLREYMQPMSQREGMGEYMYR